MNTALLESYTAYGYLYPPRPEFVVGSGSLTTYDNGLYIAQPKLNGSCAVLFLDGNGNFKLMNRHQEPLTLFNPAITFPLLHRGSGWMVLCGEYLNKNKSDAWGQTFNHKFVIWDILVYDSEFLKGTTVTQRLDLLNSLYPFEEYRLLRLGESLEGVEHDTFLYQTDMKDIYRVASFENAFVGLYPKITAVDMYEGWVLKRKDALLENCHKPLNNHLWQLKCRKPTQYYKR